MPRLISSASVASMTSRDGLYGLATEVMVFQGIGVGAHSIDGSPDVILRIGHGFGANEVFDVGSVLGTFIGCDDEGAGCAAITDKVLEKAADLCLAFPAATSQI